VEHVGVMGGVAGEASEAGSLAGDGTGGLGKHMLDIEI